MPVDMGRRSLRPARSLHTPNEFTSSRTTKKHLVSTKELKAYNEMESTFICYPDACRSYCMRNVPSREDAFNLERRFVS